MVSSILGTSQSLVGSCQDCAAGGEALAILTFPKFPILHLRHEAARYRAKLRQRLRTMADLFLANLWKQNILQNLSVVCLCYSAPRRQSVCCYHSILVISHNHHEPKFRLLAATFFSGEEKLHASTERSEISDVAQNSRIHVTSMATILFKKNCSPSAL
jgi:hypothetical protein